MPMTRSTSSLTLAIFAKLSTSASVTFGLLSTATEDEPVGVPDQNRALSRRPRMATLTRCMTFICASRRDAQVVFVRRPLRDCLLPVVDERLIGLSASPEAGSPGSEKRTHFG